MNELVCLLNVMMHATNISLKFQNFGSTIYCATLRKESENILHLLTSRLISDGLSRQGKKFFSTLLQTQEKKLRLAKDKTFFVFDF